MLENVYFFGKGPSQGQIPGLLGHVRYIVLSLYSKFQPSRCKNEEKKSNRRTDGRTTALNQ
jgi:hypothetical protein